LSGTRLPLPWMCVYVERNPKKIAMIVTTSALTDPIRSHLHIYIYILFLYITPGCIQYRECTQAEPTRLGAYGPSQPLHPIEPTTAPLHYCAFSLPRPDCAFSLPRPSANGSTSSLPRRRSPRRSRGALARSRLCPSHTLPLPPPPHFFANGSRQNRLRAGVVDRERRRSPRRSRLRARPLCKRIRSLSRFSVLIFWICFVMFGNRLVTPFFLQVLQLVLFVDWNY
jgi:hypothetical protein